MLIESGVAATKFPPSAKNTSTFPSRIARIEATVSQPDHAADGLRVLEPDQARRGGRCLPASGRIAGGVRLSSGL